MTVSSAQNKVSYAGDGATTVFSVPFLFLANADITAILRDGQGAETTWVETTDYTLSGAGNPSGGTLTAITAPATGETLVIKRVVPLTQGTDYPEGGEFPAQAHEDALDRGTMADQQLQEQIDRAVKLQKTSALTDIDLPDPGADQFLKYNAAGTGLETKDIKLQGAIGVPVSPADGGTGATTVPPADNFLVGDGTNYGVKTPAQARTSIGFDGASGVVAVGDLAAAAQRLNSLPQAIKTATPYTVVAGDVGTMLIANLGSAITFNLTAAATLGAGFLAFIKNIGAGTLTIDPAAAETIDGAATMTLAQNEWTLIWTDGTNWRSLGAMAAASGGGILVATPAVTEDATEVSTTLTILEDDTIPQSGEGAAYTQLDTNYTPAATANILIIEVLLWPSQPTSTRNVAALFKDADAGALTAGMFFEDDGIHTAFLRHKMVAGTTSQITFKVRYGPSSLSGGTMHLNSRSGTAILGGSMRSSMVIKEYTP